MGTNKLGGGRKGGRLHCLEHDLLNLGSISTSGNIKNLASLGDNRNIMPPFNPIGCFPMTLSTVLSIDDGMSINQSIKSLNNKNKSIQSNQLYSEYEAGTAVPTRTSKKNIKLWGWQLLPLLQQTDKYELVQCVESQ
jgi:hypothetical protein